MTYIKKEDLVIDTHYKCDARNFEVGLWDGRGFIYKRTKFGVKYLDIEFHYDDGPPHGTVKPLEVVDGKT